MKLFAKEQIVVIAREVVESAVASLGGGVHVEGDSHAVFGRYILIRLSQGPGGVPESDVGAAPRVLVRTRFVCPGRPVHLACFQLRVDCPDKILSLKTMKIELLGRFNF